ncbi:MAG: hypothetical protein J6T10_30085 [Methanobrevibacter sp.]|nr:hypothetical protein [Methanobrevibacter sp.]
MTKTEKKVLFEALICLLKSSAMFCINNPGPELKIALSEYINSTVKMIKELLGENK